MGSMRYLPPVKSSNAEFSGNRSHPFTRKTSGGLYTGISVYTMRPNNFVFKQFEEGCGIQVNIPLDRVLDVIGIRYIRPALERKRAYVMENNSWLEAPGYGNLPPFDEGWYWLEINGVRSPIYYTPGMEADGTWWGPCL